MPCMCGDSACPSCGEAQGTLTKSAKGFSVGIEWVPVLDSGDAVQKFTDDLLAFVESLGLEVGGGCSLSGADYYVSCYDRDHYIDVTSRQRTALVLWVLERCSGDEVCFGELGES